MLAALWLRHFLEEPLEAFLAPVGQDTGDDTWQRHKSPLYWFDADWLQALMALMGICIYDLWDRRSDRQRAGRAIIGSAPTDAPALPWARWGGGETPFSLGCGMLAGSRLLPMPWWYLWEIPVMSIRLRGFLWIHVSC